MSEAFQERLANVRRRFPDLTQEGNGRPAHVTPEEWPTFRDASREELFSRSGLREIEACVLALSAGAPAPSWGSQNSAHLKQSIDRWLALLNSQERVSHGAVIAAAIIAGFEPRRFDGTNAVLPMHPAFLGGPSAGLSYRPPRDEHEAREVDAMCDRIERREPRGGAVTESKIARSDERAEAVRADLLRLEGAVGLTGRFIASRRPNRFPIWTVQRARNLRPLRLAALLKIRDIRDMVTEFGEIVSTVEAQMTPEEGDRPAPTALAVAALALEETFARVTAACAEDLASTAPSTEAAHA